MPQRIALRPLRWIALLAIAYAFGCGGSDPDPAENNQDEDAGIVDDVGVDDDTSPPQDVAPDEDVDDDLDVESDITIDADEDIGEPDADDNGMPVDGEGDNCPEISNPDQSDRSRDGVGDACANFPYFHDPSNPETVAIIDEADGLPNNTFDDARNNWVLDLPFMLEGTILETGEIDYYAIEIDEPTTLLVHLEAQTSSLWPAMFIIGDFFDGVDYEGLFLGPNRGQSEVRDIHLPLPGRYILAVSDFANISATGSATGGEQFQYRISISTPPLPEPEVVSVPTPRKIVSYESREATIFSLDVQGEDAIKVEVSGAPRNQNSVLFPGIQLLNGDTGEGLAFTREEQVDTDSMRNQLTLKLGDEVDTVDVLVEAHTSLGTNDLVVDIDVFDKPKHLSTFENPRNQRSDDLLWMRPYSELLSMIGPPLPSSDTSLDADEDYFMFMANPGDFIRIEAEPIQGSRMVPEMAIGELSANFFFGWHRGRVAVTDGGSSSLSKLFTRNRYQDAAIQVVHSGNSFNNLPVGGPDYEYRLRLETVTIDDVVQTFDDFPAHIDVELEAGEQAIYEFPFQPGYSYEVEYNGFFGMPLRVIDTNTWEELASTTTSFSFVHRPDQDLVMALYDNSGFALNAASGVTIEITEHDGPEEIEAPQVVQGVLDDSVSEKLYRLAVSEGERIEVRTSSTAGDRPVIEIFGDAVETVESDDGAMILVEAGEDTELSILLTRQSIGTVDYLLGVHPIEPEQESLPHEQVGAFEEQVKGAWWHVELEQDQRYALNVTGQSALGEAMWFAVYYADTLEPIVEETGGFALFDSGQHDQVLLVVADPDGPVDPPADFGISISAVEPISSDDGLDTVDFVDGLRPLFIDFEPTDGGLTMLEVDPDGDHLATAMIADAQYEVFDGQPSAQALTAVARSQGFDEAVGIVIPDGHGGQTWSADIAISGLLAADAQSLNEGEATITEPLEVDAWPAVYGGDFSGEFPFRVFSADLDEGDLLWALTMPAEGTSPTGSDPFLAVVEPEGNVRFSDDTSGEGFFPALGGVEIDHDGQWRIEVEGGIDDEGEFVLFLLKR